MSIRCVTFLMIQSSCKIRVVVVLTYTDGNNHSLDSHSHPIPNGYAHYGNVGYCAHHSHFAIDRRRYASSANITL